MKEIVARTDAEAIKGIPESSMGNLVSDLLLEGANRRYSKKVDLAFLNTGGLRVEWQAGNISRAMVFELMPFENEAEVVELRGAQVKILLNQVAARGGAPVAGTKFAIEGDKAVNILIGEKTLNDTALYVLTSTDYLLNNGDKYQMPLFEKRTSLNVKFRDLLLDELARKNQEGRIIHPAKDGRIYAAH
ncbi:MAG: 5'-nucleotidase [Bacteroidia bacterium]